MQLCNSIRRGATQLPYLVRTFRRLYFRRNYRDWVLYCPLIALLFSCAILAIFLLRYAVICELPVLLINQMYHRTDETKEFWPYSISSEIAASIVANTALRGSTLTPAKNIHSSRISFLRNSLPPCDSTIKHDIIILIKSSLQGRAHREKLRSTWASSHFLGSIPARVKYAFLIGNPKLTLESDETRAVEEEITRHGDFIIGDFKDGYRSLIHKAMMSFQWVEDFCPHYEFLLIIDDDFDLHLKSLIQFLRDPEGYPNSNHESETKTFSKICQVECKDFYAGYALPHYYTPDRNPQSKTFLSREEYPPDVLPVYVTGLIIIMSKKTASSINHLAPFIPRVSIEDIFIGLVARKLKIPTFAINRYMMTKYNVDRFFLDTWKSPETAIGRTQHTFGCD